MTHSDYAKIALAINDALLRGECDGDAINAGREEAIAQGRNDGEAIVDAAKVFGEMVVPSRITAYAAKIAKSAGRRVST